MAAQPGVSAAPVQRTTNRWSSHRAQALGLRAVVYLGPIATSIAFVHYAGQVVPAPLSSLWVYLAWWFGLSVAATGVLVLIDRLLRRLLPLAALLQLSLVFPDEAPSRFRVAFRAGDVGRLEARLAAKEAAVAAATPSEAAGRLLELVAALNIHDPLTRGHCDRVRAYSVLIGEELGLSRAELVLLNWAALLHDVGKLDVPTEILAKDGRPTDAEWEVLRRHPLDGESLVEPMRDWLGTWMSAIGFHHERFDGTGYPRGLGGDEIPLPGRIVAVADVFDVITSARSYKRASAAEDARAEIARCAGTQFDPDVVRAFLNVSLGRMRFVMGPLSWLAHAPLLGRLPFTPALGTAAGVLSVVATSAAAGIAGPKAPSATVAPPTPTAAAAPARHQHRILRETVRPRHPSRVVVVARRTPAATPTFRPPAPPSPPSATPTQTHGTGPGPPSPTPPPSAPAPAPAPPPPPVAAAPAFTAGPDLVVLEDAAPVSRAWATDLSSTDRFVAMTDAPELFAAAPAVSPSGVLSFALAKDAFGTATVAVSAIGAAGTSVGHTLRITILPVNDPPTFAGGGDVTTVEDSGPQTVAWASDVSPGPPNEASQHVTFSLTTDNPSLFTPGGLPEAAPDGELSFTPAMLTSGTATVTATAIDDGGTANGGVDHISRTFRIIVLPRNHAPVVTGLGDLSVPEDAPAQSVQWVTSIDPGAPNESGQTVTLAAASDHPELFSTPPSLSQSGLITYTPAPDAFGTASVTIIATDDGGTANGGSDRTTMSFTITIRPVNDPPSFLEGGNVSLFEDAGPQTISWASSISPGPPNESGQTVAFTSTNSDPALFDPGAQPAVAADGTLTFTPAFGASGSATVTVVAHDDGGTADGGVDTSAPATFTITVVAVNQPPTFTAGGDVTALEDAGPQSLPWATAISPGPNEPTQTVSFTVTNSNNALFATQPTIDAGGTLTYTSAANANGSATVTVVAHDDGGTANGGSDTSAPATFTLTVTPVNDPPTIAAIAPQSANEDDGTQTVALTSFTPGPPDESGQTLTVTTSNDNPSLFDVAGQPAVDSSGTLTYTPATGAYGTANVTITVQDDGGTANGGVDTATATFTITIAPLPPVAGADSYATTVGTLLTVNAAQGVLTNDADVNSSTLTVTPETVSNGPLGGTLTLNADGSFTYLALTTPGQDSFTYTITDGLGQTATGTIAIDVGLAPPTGGTFYLQTSGLSADVWGLDTTAPAAVSPVPDLDGDGHPGLTIASGDGKITIPEPNKQKAWTYEPGASTLSLHGPLTLNLTAAS